MKALATLLLAAALSAGCTTIRTARSFNGVRTDGGTTPMCAVEIENSGWFLFTCIPIASGNPDLPNMNSCRWFRNTVSLASNMKVLKAEMTRNHVKEVSNLTSHCEDEKYLVFLISRRAYHTSAVLLKDTSKPLSKAKK